MRPSPLSTGTTKVLELALNRSHPKVEVPPSLHASIMRAIRVSSPTSARKEVPTARGKKHLPQNLWWWLAVPSTALLALAVWSIGQRGGWDNSPATPLYPAVAALKAGAKITRDMPIIAVAPLTEELERLDQDLESARQLLAASLP